jgi:hypothetical protein
MLWLQHEFRTHADADELKRTGAEASECFSV